MYKPGNVSRVPPVVAPHQPRLDWQMWFAALAHHSSSPWFTSFVYRLLQGKEDGEWGWGLWGWGGSLGLAPRPHSQQSHWCRDLCPARGLPGLSPPTKEQQAALYPPQRGPSLPPSSGSALRALPLVFGAAGLQPRSSLGCPRSEGG